METAQEDAIDTLSSLELRITRAVEVLTALRAENDDLRKEVATLKAGREELSSQAEESRTEATTLTLQVKKLTQELDDLKSERKQVKTRIEKLLGQMDLLSAS